MGLRIGVLGNGFIAQYHMHGYSEADGIDRIVCCDILADRAKQFSEKWGIHRHYTDYRDMLREEDLDVLSVCTPNRFHLEHTVAALKKGIHVLCEKPIALNSREAKKMVDEAKKAKRLLTIGHNLRFEADNRALKKIIETGELGEIYFGRSHTIRRVGIPGWGQFHKKEISAGGPLIDIGVHGLDLILWFMGFPGIDTVSGAAYAKFGNSKDQLHSWNGALDPSEFTVEDFACGFARLRNGASLVLESSWAGHIEKDSFQQVVLGDRGGAQTKPHRVYTTRGGVHVDMDLVELEDVDSYREEILHFLACVRGKARVIVRPEESLQVMQLIEALYRSAETGKEVKVRDSTPVTGAPKGRK
ncbi:MAG: Gfo/Idh/MocA family oxidoreductase [Candidatus Omnitrophica bacterium]|nr:Gfo/Idh/MocA family oxidoreductase [Candidatus Omnitrophota bacterium]